MKTKHSITLHVYNKQTMTRIPEYQPLWAPSCFYHYDVVTTTTLETIMMVKQSIFYLFSELFGKSNGLGVYCVNGVKLRKNKVL
jgi:hypothetical protein